MMRAVIRDVGQMVEGVMDCFFCPLDAALSSAENSDRTIIECPRCGRFETTRRAHLELSRKSKKNPIASGWIREQNSLGVMPLLNLEKIPHLDNLRKPTFKERAERYLLAAIPKCELLNSAFHSHDEDLIGVSYSKTLKEMMVIRNYLIGEGLLFLSGGDLCDVTAKGHIAADELRSHRAKSNQGFVAMWFAPDMKPIYDDGLSIGIGNAGYTPMRVDQKEHANKIDDEIIAEIRRSAFLVADFTGHRGGVYFEAGFAMGLGLPVVWTCRKDNIKDLHFDIRQYNCIDWSEADELSTRLQQRIEAMFGRGPMGDLR